MISQATEYALRAVMHLARQQGRSCTTQEIARAGCIPAPFLSKVLQALGRAGIVRSQRGLRGGFVLVREPRELSILDVVNAVDPIKRITSCPLKLAEHGPQLCPLHRRLDAALESVETAFRETHLADLLPPQSSRKRDCRFPQLVGGHS